MTSLSASPPSAKGKDKARRAKIRQRIGEFISKGHGTFRIDGGWRELWSIIDAPVIGGALYLALILIAHFIGKAVQ